MSKYLWFKEGKTNDVELVENFQSKTVNRHDVLLSGSCRWFIHDGFMWIEQFNKELPRHITIPDKYKAVALLIGFEYD